MATFRNNFFYLYRARMTLQFLITWFFFRECGFVWSVSEESEQVLVRWEHAGTTWRSDLMGLVLAFNFSSNSVPKSFHLTRLLAVARRSWVQSSQLLQCPDGPCCESILRFSFTLHWLQFWLTWNNHREMFPEMNSEFQFLIPKLSTTSGQFLLMKMWLEIISHVFGNQCQLF
jgi:hypothetical protein